MPPSNPPTEPRPRPRPEDSPIAWFGELLLAIERGDLDRALEARHELARLGWSVAPRKRRPSRGREGQ